MFKGSHLTNQRNISMAGASASASASASAEVVVPPKERGTSGAESASRHKGPDQLGGTGPADVAPYAVPECCGVAPGRRARRTHRGNGDDDDDGQGLDVDDDDTMPNDINDGDGGNDNEERGLRMPRKHWRILADAASQLLLAFRMSPTPPHYATSHRRDDCVGRVIYTYDPT